MRSALRLSAIGAAILLSTAAAQAQFFSSGIYDGNDTGGIISWSCEAEATAREVAQAHCARFNKFARITSVKRMYGDFIGFNCLWRPDIARFQIPEARTRSTCRATYRGPSLRVRY
ncbi:MAG: hypothetical protein ACRECO_22600 [Xanthobacteraceae bacterium]